MRFRSAILFSLAFILPSAIAQVPEYTRHISKAFKTTNITSVEISNKYGKVQIIPTDADSVKFAIDFRIKAKDNQKLEKMKQNVEFEFTPGSYFIVARTKFGENSSDVFKDIMDIAGSYLSSSNSVTINYTVWLPSNISLKIENKFGDVYIADHNSSLTLFLSYGDLRANRLNGRSEIKLSSGDGEINYLKEGTVTISYANLHVRESSRMTAQAQSSVLTIDKGGSLKLNSRRDKVYLNEISSLSGETYFSDVNIGSLKSEINLSSRYGDIIADDIQSGFSFVNINSELTDLTLGFEKPLSFEFDMTHFQTVSMIYPVSAGKLSTKLLDAEEKLYLTTGIFGTGNPDAKVSIKALRKCNVSITQH